MPATKSGWAFLFSEINLLVGAIDLNRLGGSGSPGGINRSGLEMVADSRIPQGEPPLPFLQAKQKRTRRENAERPTPKAFARHGR